MDKHFRRPSVHPPAGHAQNFPWMRISLNANTPFRRRSFGGSTTFRWNLERRSLLKKQLVVPVGKRRTNICLATLWRLTGIETVRNKRPNYLNQMSSKSTKRRCSSGRNLYGSESQDVQQMGHGSVVLDFSIVVFKTTKRNVGLGFLVGTRCISVQCLRRSTMITTSPIFFSGIFQACLRFDIGVHQRSRVCAFLQNVRGPSGGEQATIRNNSGHIHRYLQKRRGPLLLDLTTMYLAVAPFLEMGLVRGGIASNHAQTHAQTTPLSPFDHFPVADNVFVFRRR